MDLVSTHLGCRLEKFPLSYLGITYCATPTRCLFSELCMPSFHNAEWSRLPTKFVLALYARVARRSTKAAALSAGSRYVSRLTLEAWVCKTSRELVRFAYGDFGSAILMVIPLGAGSSFSSRQWKEPCSLRPPSWVWATEPTWCSGKIGGLMDVLSSRLRGLY
jgi:hypothetical protein